MGRLHGSHNTSPLKKRDPYNYIVKKDLVLRLVITTNMNYNIKYMYNIKSSST